MTEKPVNPCLAGDGAEAAAVDVDLACISDPRIEVQNAYRRKVRKELAAARYRDWLRERHGRSGNPR